MVSGNTQRDRGHRAACWWPSCSRWACGPSAGDGRSGSGILLGGALGNLIDRAFRAGDGFLGGRVVDMVDLQWWPVFNVADAALWVGIGVLVLDSLRDGAEST